MIKTNIIIYLLFIIIFYTGCEATTNSSKQDHSLLTDTSWNLERIKYENNEETISKNDPLEIMFKSDGTIEGTGGGNTFYGTFSYSSENNSIDIKPEGMTYAGVPGNSKVFTFMESLEKAELYLISNNTLEIIFNNHNRLLFSVKD